MLNTLLYWYVHHIEDCPVNFVLLYSTLYCTLYFTKWLAYFCSKTSFPAFWLVHFAEPYTLQCTVHYTVDCTVQYYSHNTLYSTVQYYLHHIVNCTVKYYLQHNVHSTVQCTISLSVQRHKSEWPILLRKLPSLTPLQCTAYFTIHCTFNPNVILLLLLLFF